MTTTTITAGDASTGLAHTGGNDGTMVLQAGPSGGKVNAISIDASGNVTPLALVGGKQIVAGTAVTLSAQTTITFTGIPSWAKRVKMFISGANAASAGIAQIQVGSGSLLTSGYNSNIANINSGAGQGNITSGHGLIYTSVTGIYTGVIEWVNVSGNSWIATGLNSYGNAGQMTMATTSVTLGGSLDRIALTTTAGNIAFNSGTINVTWE